MLLAMRALAVVEGCGGVAGLFIASVGVDYGPHSFSSHIASRLWSSLVTILLVATGRGSSGSGQRDTSGAPPRPRGAL